ncbi:MAG: pilin [bacterium]|nr:pilin [bacterium]
MNLILSKKLILTASLILLCAFVFIFSQSISAANLKDAFDASDEKQPLMQVADKAGYKLTESEIEPMIAKIIQAALSFLGIVFLLLTIYGGYLWMTARGNEQQVEKAKNLLTAAVIGLIIVLAAYTISYFVIQMLGEQTLKSTQ